MTDYYHDKNSKKNGTAQHKIIEASFVAFENLNFNYLKVIGGALPACDKYLAERICSKLNWSSQVSTVQGFWQKKNLESFTTLIPILMKEKGTLFIRTHFCDAVREFCMNPALTVCHLESVACIDKLLFGYLEGMTIPAYR